MAKCAATKRDGMPCRKRALPGKRLCQFHSPKLAGRFRAGRQKGGRNAQARLAAPVVVKDVPALPLNTAADVMALLAETINQLRTLGFDVKVANAIGQLAAVLIKVIPGCDLEARIQTLEARR